jgi:hypothetical protein
MGRQGRCVKIAIAATAALYAAAVSLGAFASCWPSEHSHDGLRAAECPMHHPSGSGAGEHGHHAADAHRAHALVPAPDDGPKVTCGCVDGLRALALGGAAILPALGLVEQLALTDGAAGLADERAHVLHSSPLSPPPRLRSAS